MKATTLPIISTKDTEGVTLNYTRTGLVLCTELYDQCVAFYSNIMELPILEMLDDQYSKLTVLRFGHDGYLMIETGGDFSSAPKMLNENPVVLRFNVTSVDKYARILMSKGVRVIIRIEPWGTVGDFVDPDGNRCSLREEWSRFSDN